ncbi:MAG: hypothetical protein R3E89_02520 [Thiolinea sp.]
MKWAVEQGHTVFMISWRNPGSEQSELSLPIIWNRARWQHWMPWNRRPASVN